MLVIVITVVILELILLNAVKQYYYKSLEDVLSNQIELSSEFYSRYFSSSSLEDLIIDDVDVFWKQTNGQVQILDLKGNVLMDSIGVAHLDRVQSSDILKSKNEEKGLWIGNVDYDSSPVMAISYPLISDEKIIGIIRFITSLKATNNAIRSISLVLVWVGLMVILISGLVSIFLSNTIVKPLKEVTEVAKKMADGQLEIRSQKKYDDEIGKLSDTLNYMAEELIKKEELKNDFVSSISHELRTPLTSIKGWAITLKSEDLSNNIVLEDGLDIIEKESNRLTYMVEELLDFSRLVSSRITLNKEDMDIVEIMDQVNKQLTPRANLKKVSLKMDVKEELPIILGDENRIKQVFINLIDNSLKFSPRGETILFSAKLKGQYIEICVEDRGSGILKEDLPYVKEKFYKGKDSESNSGLGLSICDEIVKLHSGLMKIESKVNVGTSICIFLPLKEELDR